MKGIVFTEFLEMVEQEFGILMVDDIIESSNLPSGGAYTAISTYEHAEMVALVSQLSKRTNKSVDELLRAYGKYQFPRFAKAYPAFFENVNDIFQFLEGLENYIHPEVKKLYPDAELPRFDTKREESGKLEMVYHSDRKMADFAHGLIEGAIEYFQESMLVEMEAVEADKSIVKFTVTRH